MANEKFRNEDTITRLSREGIHIGEQMNAAVEEVFGSNALDVDEFVSAYRQATFEQRHQMFLEVFASQGADGLEFLAETQARAEDSFLRGEL